ncbi:MAG: Rrf2 family transcriptional regulator [Candidatus Schekmanbacteria bacterium]|nr:Rrf2 family transcriptional regulator [Candidatus Schekmanbacteria bacterium]
MRLSKKGEYAIRALIALAMNYESSNKGLMQTHEIVQQENIPGKFLEQILLMLRNAGYLQSKRGIGGGYYLNRPPHKITLGEVIRLFDGPLAPLSCVSKTAHVTCEREASCGLYNVMYQVRKVTVEILDRITLADVCDHNKGDIFKKDEILMFQI